MADIIPWASIDNVSPATWDTFLLWTDASDSNAPKECAYDDLSTAIRSEIVAWDIPDISSTYATVASLPDELTDLDTTVTGTQLDAIKTKTDYLTVTQAVDLDQMETDIAALANGMVYKGDWDASSGSFPWWWSAQTGWFYYVSVWWTVDSVTFNVGDNIVATTDNASTTTYASNWSKHDQTDAVQAVAWLTGSIAASSLRDALTLDTDDDVSFNTVTANSVDAPDTSGLDIRNASNTVIANFGAWWWNNATIQGALNINWSENVLSNSNTQTVTNKTIALWSNTVSGTKAEFDTACTDGNFVYEWDTDASWYSFVVDEDTMSSDSATKLPTQQSVKAYVDTYRTESFIIACSDETTALTTWTAKATFRMPYAFTVTDVRASLTGAWSTSGTTTIDINESGTTILSTKLTIDQWEKTSTTAATAAVISDSALADDAEITIDIDAVTGWADETGLKVYIIGYQS